VRLWEALGGSVSRGDTREIHKGLIASRESLVPPRTPGVPVTSKGSIGAPRQSLGHPKEAKGSSVPSRDPLGIPWDFPETQFFGGWVLTAGL